MRPVFFLQRGSLFFLCAARHDQKGEIILKNNKKTLIAVILAAVLLLGAVLAWTFLRPEATQGAKTITVTVDHLEGEDKTFTLHTDAEYLRGALDEENLIAGTESEYGLYVLTVDGETADEDQQEWWGFTVNGEFGLYGVDEQVVSDGDTFAFTLNVGW